MTMKFMTCLVAVSLALRGADAGDTSTAQQIARLQAAVAAQQKEIEVLQRTLERQQEQLEIAPQPPLHTNVATFSPQKSETGTSANPCESASETNAVPPYLRLGSVCIVPVGFMDLT